MDSPEREGTFGLRKLGPGGDAKGPKEVGEPNAGLRDTDDHSLGG